MYAICDCNNFFVSCERLFRPDLEGRPVIVLSSNDGCAVARSNEAKACGIPMGAPMFKYADLIRQNNIECFSSNFALYGDISQRVMATIRACWELVEVYSIDEAFLDVSSLPLDELSPFAHKIRRTVTDWVGVPISVGIAPTKTLAKLANRVAKAGTDGVYQITHAHDPEVSTLLDRMAAEEVWGIGQRLARRLREIGIYTAGDLARANTKLINRRFGLIVSRVVAELNGVIAGTPPVRPQQRILVSRSFGRLTDDFDVVLAAIAKHISSGGEKLRRLQAVANTLTVFAITSRHRKDLPQHRATATMRLPFPTADNIVLMSFARQLFRSAYASGYQYKKAGILLEDLVHLEEQAGVAPSLGWQDDLWNPPPVSSSCLMEAVDTLTERFGKRVVTLGTSAYAQQVAPLSQKCTPRYTTHWRELAEVSPEESVAF